MICPNQLHKFTVSGETVWEHYWVGFGGSDVGRLLECEGLPHKNSALSFNLTDSAQSLLKSFFENHNKRTVSNALGKSFLYYIISLLPLMKKQLSDISERAAAIINKQYSEKITVEDIAGFLHISSKHLYRVFSKTYGISPQQYLIRTRIDRAEKLLKASNLRVGEIAASVGFSCPFHFSQMFKQYKGVSPTDFRKKLPQFISAGVFGIKCRKPARYRYMRELWRQR